MGHWGDTHLRYERDENKYNHDESMHMDVSCDESTVKAMADGLHGELSLYRTMDAPFTPYSADGN